MTTTNQRRRKLLASTFLLLSATEAAATRRADGKPEPMFSLTDDTPVTIARTGPLFERVKTAVNAVGKGNENLWKAMVAPNLQAEFWRPESLGGPQKIDSVAALIKAATQSCLGPYQYDEGTSWLQFSWVCRVGDQTTLARFYKFTDSPELTITLSFEKNKISKIEVMEPVVWPGRRLISMNAVARREAEAT